MSTYRRLVRAKKGMSTIFGALFFIILVLMGFNLMLWNFIQYDAYNSVINSMGTRDQQVRLEHLSFNAPGATGFTSTYMNISVNNDGGVSAQVARIYVVNLAPTVSTNCQGASLCTVDTTGSPRFSNGNIQSGENNHIVKVTGLLINDGNGYKVTFATTRGNQFSFFYPWPVNLGGGGPSNSNSTNTAHGALDVKFDINSINFTRGSQTVSQPGWTVPYGTPLVYWVKVVNNAISPITLSQYTSLYFVCYQDRFGSNYGTCTETDLSFVVDNSTMNPNTLVAYNENTNPYVIPAAGPNGPNGYRIVKFGSFCPGSTCGNPPPNQDVDYPTPYLVFMGFFYRINGQIVGQTISFVAIRACTTYPSCP